MWPLAEIGFTDLSKSRAPVQTGSTGLLKIQILRKGGLLHQLIIISQPLLQFSLRSPLFQVHLDSNLKLWFRNMYMTDCILLLNNGDAFTLEVGERMSRKASPDWGWGQLRLSLRPQLQLSARKIYLESVTYVVGKHAVKPNYFKKQRSSSSFLLT